MAGPFLDIRVLKDTEGIGAGRDVVEGIRGGFEGACAKMGRSRGRIAPRGSGHDPDRRPQAASTARGTARPEGASSAAPSWYSASVLTFQVSNEPRPRMFRAARSAVIIEWSWMLYLCMP